MFLSRKFLACPRKWLSYKEDLTFFGTGLLVLSFLTKFLAVAQTLLEWSWLLESWTAVLILKYKESSSCTLQVLWISTYQVPVFTEQPNVLGAAKNVTDHNFTWKLKGYPQCGIASNTELYRANLKCHPPIEYEMVLGQRATITKYHRLGGLINHTHEIVTILEAGKFKTKAPADSVSDECLLLHSQITIILPCPHRVCSMGPMSLS